MMYINITRTQIPQKQAGFVKGNGQQSKLSKPGSS